MAIKKPARKPTFVDRARASYQETFDQRNDPAKRTTPKPTAAKPAGRQWGEPAEFTEAQKASIRANRAAAKKRSGK